MTKKRKSNGKNRRWTDAEERALLKQVRVFPHNLTKCFLIVSEEIGRTPGAVANHWYSKTSKDPNILCFFTASSKHYSQNRKNGAGVEITESMWGKFVRLIRNIFHNNDINR